MTTHARQPFAALDGARLKNLTSIKNRQNAISTQFSSPSKQSLASPTKRRYSPSSFEDAFDSENMDPSIFSSPTKRSKNIDGTALKPSKFILTDAAPSSPKPASSLFSTAPEKRKTPALSVSLPATTNATPINHSRGSPKHKRVGLLSKRRASSSPFRRIDPPFMRAPASGAGLPFSIDAALSGTISSYTPKQEKILEEAMPKSWFFDIHEDTPEEEAANLMEHSALCLDISSDDDVETKRLNLEKERGKENVPPPDFHTNASPARSANHSATDAASKPKRGRRVQDPEAMIEDREALGDLNAADFYPEGLDATSVVVAAEEGSDDVVQLKPSGLAHETKVDADISQPETTPAVTAPAASAEGTEEPSEVTIWVDESAPHEHADEVV